jgi:LysR family transcriptional regulator, pca operon transcriptional activator
MSSRLNRIRLRHVQTLVTVARQGSLRAAAEVLAVSQPAVSKTLDELEDIVGCVLIARSRKGAVLTPEGEVFVRHGAQSLDALGLALQAVHGDEGMDVLRIGALPTMAAALVPRALLDFWRERPQSTVHLSTGSNPVLLVRLSQREVDVVVGRFADPSQMVGLTYEHLTAEPMVAVVRSAHPMVAGHACVQAWAQCAWIVPSAGTAIRHQADSVLRAHGVELTPRLETLDVSLARQLVLGSDMVWITSASTVMPDVKQGALWAIPWLTDASAEPVGVLMRQDTPATPSMRAWLAALRRQLTQAGAA